MIRRAEASDWPEMADVFRRAGKAAWGHILAPESLENLNPPDRWHPDSSFAYVAVKDSKVVGFCVLIPGEIDAFYTDPAVWGQGFGQALMAVAIDHMRETGCESVELWTAEANHRPRRFYSALGFTATGQTRTRERDGVEWIELRLAKKLAKIQT